MKVYVHPPGENWICDRLAQEWRENNKDISTLNPNDADIIWLMADWTYNHFPLQFLKNKKVLTTCFHIIPEQQGQDFNAKDFITDIYHASCKHTENSLRKYGTKKPIISEPIWANDLIWKPLDRKKSKIKFGFNENDFIIGSFQRDTEGKDLISPKLIKGPDIFCDFVEKFIEQNPDKNIKVLLGAWRRQYVISRLEKAGISYVYNELPNEDMLNIMYNALDLYVVGSRLEGGPQSVYECAFTKTPIISTNVGIAPEILSNISIADGFDADSLLKCKPDVDYAYNTVSNFSIQNSMPKFRKILEDLYNE